METHELKTIDPYFEMVWNGNKKFELRKNDRDFKKGDALVLKEYIQSEERYTSRTIWCIVTCVIEYTLAMQKDYVALGLANFQCYRS